MRYLRGTLNHGLSISVGSIDSLRCYNDADWVGCPTTCRSTLAYCMFLGSNFISWPSKKQSVISQSSAETEYRSVTHAAAEITWLHSLLQDLHIFISLSSIIFCDNVSNIYLAHNPIQHAHTEHIEIDIHFIREKVASSFIQSNTVQVKINLRIF